MHAPVLKSIKEKRMRNKRLSITALPAVTTVNDVHSPPFDSSAKSATTGRITADATIVADYSEL